MRYGRSNNSAPSPYFFYAAVLLLCAFLLSTGAVVGNWARYRTQDEGGDSARVITFGELSVNSTENATPLVPGLDSAWQAYVSFEGSEAQTYVFVRITLDSGWSCNSGKLTALDGNISMQIADGWTMLSFDSGEAVIYKTLAPSQTLENSPIFANDGKISVSTEVNASELSGMNTKMIVKAFAVQANGFSDVSTAWSSVSGRTGGA